MSSQAHDLITRMIHRPEKVIRIPELRNIPLLEHMMSLIDHPAFQRLRSIRQLGPIQLVYPGAVHTRFEHSLGVYGYALVYLASLLSDRSLRASLSERDVLSVLAAALLHDIGHYPFAHCLEALHYKGRATPRHEDLADDIIFGRSPTARLERALSDGSISLATLLSKRWGVEPERVVALIRSADHLTDPVDRLLASILSGPIDADKMDYLERDSIHMGVPYGRNYDRERLLASLTVNRDGDAIAITHKGRVSAEIFIFCRYTMFSEAYWHHTARGVSAMVTGAIGDFLHREQPSAESLRELILLSSDEEFLRMLLDSAPAESATRTLLTGITGPKRRIYKPVATLNRALCTDEQVGAFDRLYNMNVLEVECLRTQLSDELSSLLGRRIPLAWILLDVPPRDKDHLSEVQVRLEPDGYRPLHEISRIVSGVQHDFVKVVKNVRLFVHPQLRPVLSDHGIEPLQLLLDCLL